MNFADAIIKLLEEKGVKYIFGHPGEQILPLYEAIRKSNIEHVLMRHEQGAVHAADGYARASGKFGVCIASAGPGALNLTMGVATAYKDSVPLLVITGDVNLSSKGCNVFQEVETARVFKPITLESWEIKNPKEGMSKLGEAFKIFSEGRTGPIHLSIPRDVFNGKIYYSIPEELLKTPSYHEEFAAITKLIEKSVKPVIIAGAGVLWSDAEDKLHEFALKHDIPVAATFPSRGVFPENNPLYLGMVGIRGTEAANFAGKNADLIIALGSRLSERTMQSVGACRIIQVNTDENCHKGTINIAMDIKEFLNFLRDVKTPEHGEWMDKLGSYKRRYYLKTEFYDTPVKPQRAIKEILDASQDAIIVNDAGSHTTWVTLLQEINRPSSHIFSGGFGPMGYALPAAVGVALARPEGRVVVIAGDGGFQMTIQELATIVEKELPIVICIINNQSLGIIKQWQRINYAEHYEVELLNPDFVALAHSYGMSSKRVSNPGDIYKIVIKALKSKKPYIIEIIVDGEEEIPLPSRE